MTLNKCLVDCAVSCYTASLYARPTEAAAYVQKKATSLRVYQIISIMLLSSSPSTVHRLAVCCRRQSLWANPGVVSLDFADVRLVTSSHTNGKECLVYSLSLIWLRRPLHLLVRIVVLSHTSSLSRNDQIPPPTTSCQPTQVSICGRAIALTTGILIHSRTRVYLTCICTILVLSSRVSHPADKRT